MSNTPEIEIISSWDDEMISYAHEGDAGLDLRALSWGDRSMPVDGALIYPGSIEKFRTGIKVAIPDGYFGLIAPRSGLGAKGITVANSPGIIDSGYRGEVIVAIQNLSNAYFSIKRGDRIAQLLILPVAHALLTRVDKFSTATKRGEGGFGSTGVK